MEETTVRGRGQVTIPTGIRKAARLEEGDPLEVELVPEGILLRPRKVIDSTQAWFWTLEWQAGEREAEQEIASGGGTRYDTDEEFLDSLRRDIKP